MTPHLHSTFVEGCYRCDLSEDEMRCWCCDQPTEPRDPDPWEGRLDGYCEACALARCDAYPGDCPEQFGSNARGVVS